MKKRKVGGFVSRLVPNGVDATTAEWEGGAFQFICEGAGRLFPCARGKGENILGAHLLLVIMSNLQFSYFQEKGS